MQVNSKARHTTKKKPHDAILKQFINLPGSSVGKESTCNAGDPGSIPGLGRSPGEGIGYPLQYFWSSLVAQMVKNPPAVQETWVWSPGDWGVGRSPGGGQGNSLQYSCLKNPHGQGCLAGYSPWGDKESDTTEWLSTAFLQRVKYILLGGEEHWAQKM